MPLSALRLAEALASRLNAIVPSPIHVLVEEPSSSGLSLDADVIIRVADGTEPRGGHGFSNLDLQPDSPSSLGDVACSMAVAMLNGVQDWVIRILQGRWPRSSAGDIAVPDGRADSDCVYLWYGASEDHAVLTLEPITLREISV